MRFVALTVLSFACTGSEEPGEDDTGSEPSGPETAEVSNVVDGTDYVTSIDATAGGFEEASKNPWVYVKFTEDGAVRVDIDDESALESMDWDLAAHRFKLRLNGGTSGPSCVGAMPFLERSYEDLTEV